ncbi:MAG: hypothetical protein PHD54_08320 [Desulfuromonadaceae bacterium]|nr:hypothetical protein [Desulfuromonadaceae bacterium]
MSYHKRVQVGQTGNLAECEAIKEMSAMEAATAICDLAAKLPKSLGMGIWEGKVEGELPGQTIDGKHLGVFDENTLIALFGPHGDPLSETAAALFVMSIINAEKILASLQENDVTV